MKEVKKCSISGVAFTMDADAYEALETYLESLKTTYKDTADGAEIVADIEARIAELILSAQDNTRIVEKPLILNIIRQMGSADGQHAFWAFSASLRHFYSSERAPEPDAHSVLHPSAFFVSLHTIPYAKPDSRNE